MPEIQAAPGTPNATTIGALTRTTQHIQRHPCNWVLQCTSNAAPPNPPSAVAVKQKPRCSGRLPYDPLPLAAGPVPSVAQEQHVNVVKRALADVAVYLSGARWEVQHRNAVAFAQLQVMKWTTSETQTYAHSSRKCALLTWGTIEDSCATRSEHRASCQYAEKPD